MQLLLIFAASSFAAWNEFDAKSLTEKVRSLVPTKTIGASAALRYTSQTYSSQRQQRSRRRHRKEAVFEDECARSEYTNELIHLSSSRGKSSAITNILRLVVARPQKMIARPVESNKIRARARTKQPSKQAKQL